MSQEKEKFSFGYEVMEHPFYFWPWFIGILCIFVESLVDLLVTNKLPSQIILITRLIEGIIFGSALAAFFKVITKL